VAAFLDGELAFPGISACISQVMEAHRVVPGPDLEELIAAGEEAARQTRDFISAYSRGGDS
jgi:1-deoxy-D-xylulose 5-phosphate reductoisomerase